MESQRRAVVGRSKRGGLKLLLLLPMLALFAGCDLAITKTDTPDPVNVGEPLTYTLNVSNTPADPPPPQGQGDWPQVVVDDTLPQSVDFISATPSQGTCSPPAGNGVVSCALGPLGLNESATIEIVVAPQAAGEIQNTASVQGINNVVPLQDSPSVTQQQYEEETCSSPPECDPPGNNTTTITTTVVGPAAPDPPDTPAPPEDQYGPDDGRPGEEPDDVIDGVPPAAPGGFPAGSTCANIVSGINAASANNASQSGGGDTASQSASGNGNTQVISQDEAQAIAQQNNTTIEVVQQCAQGSGINVIGVGGAGTATNSGANTTDNIESTAGAVAGSGSGNVARAVGALDGNGNGVIGEAEARAALGSDAPEALNEADADADGIVSVAEAEALASEFASEQSEVATESSASAVNGDSPETISVLPDTGGVSLLILAFGVLLVAGSLVARRVIG